LELERDEMTMPPKKTKWSRFLIAGALAATCTVAMAAYKARPWSPRARESYRAVQTSEGVTIAVDPLFRDNLAAQVFDKNDIVSRGIMPVAIIVFNDNDHPIEINGNSIELILGGEHIRPLPPDEFIPALFKKGASKLGGLNPFPRGTGVDTTTADAQEDFEHKFLANKIVAPHVSAGGFVYFRVPQSPTFPEQLAPATVYVPDVLRADNNTRLMYFEIDVKPAVEATK
jgi:hypothetical protein